MKKTNIDKKIFISVYSVVEGGWYSSKTTDTVSRIVFEIVVLKFSYGVGNISDRTDRVGTKTKKQ